MKRTDNFNYKFWTDENSIWSSMETRILLQKSSKLSHGLQSLEKSSANTMIQKIPHKCHNQTGVVCSCVLSSQSNKRSFGPKQLKLLICYARSMNCQVMLQLCAIHWHKNELNRSQLALQYTRECFGRNLKIRLFNPTWRKSRCWVFFLRALRRSLFRGHGHKCFYSCLWKAFFYGWKSNLRSKLRCRFL